MPSHDPQSQNATRPDPKARAAALKAAAARTLSAAAGALAQEATDEPRPSAAEALVVQITEAWHLYAQAERDGLSDDATGWIDARRSALLDAAEALPATSENVPAKALALAWITFVHLWHAGWSRDDYATDGRLALDIEVAIASAGPSTIRPTTAPPATGDPLRLPEPRRLIQGMDMTALPLRELAVLRKASRTIGDVASAITCRPNSRRGESGGFSPSGQFADWICGVADEVTEAVQLEAFRRPSDTEDEDRRLTILAEYVVANGDRQEMQTLARDLAAEAIRETSASASHG